MTSVEKSTTPKQGGNPDAAERIPSIVRALARAHPRARTALAHADDFELLIATILSAQCTDEMVNKVTPKLFGRFPDARALAQARAGDVEKIVYPTGFFRQKTRAIIGCSTAIVERHGGRVPRSMDELVKLPGVARKTANVLLSNTSPKADHGIFVDTHVRRISQRLGLTTQTNPDKIEKDLMALVPRRKWADFPHQLIELGRRECEAKRPRHDECPLLRWCPTGRQALHGSVPGRRLRSAGAAGS